MRNVKNMLLVMSLLLNVILAGALIWLFSHVFIG